MAYADPRWKFPGMDQTSGFAFKQQCISSLVRGVEGTCFCHFEVEKCYDLLISKFLFFIAFEGISCCFFPAIKILKARRHRL